MDATPPSKLRASKLSRVSRGASERFLLANRKRVEKAACVSASVHGSNDSDFKRLSDYLRVSGRNDQVSASANHSSENIC